MSCVIFIFNKVKYLENEELFYKLFYDVVFDIKLLIVFHALLKAKSFSILDSS